MMVALSTTVTPARGLRGGSPCRAGRCTGCASMASKVVSTALPPGLPGVPVRFATNPSCLPLPLETTWPLAVTSGSSSAAWVVW